MIWITSADSDPDDISVGIGVGSQKCYEVEQTDEHKDHKDDVGYADFNWYTTNSNSPLERNVPYTVIENDNLGYKITYNTNGGSEVRRSSRMCFQQQVKLNMNLQAGTQTRHSQRRLCRAKL